jgi:hypothetical protein
LRWVLKYGVRQTASSVDVSTGVVSRTTQRAHAVGLTWELAKALSETVLEERLYGRALPPGAARAEPDVAWMHAELKRPGMTLELLHMEYLAAHPNGLRYTAFSDDRRRLILQSDDNYNLQSRRRSDGVCEALEPRSRRQAGPWERDGHGQARSASEAENG